MRNNGNYRVGFNDVGASIDFLDGGLEDHGLVNWFVFVDEG
jgi:hypothetical protein